jgi:hypothetical protein
VGGAAGEGLAMLKWLFTLQALVDVLYGLPLIVASKTLLSIFGMSTDATGTYLAQFLGGVFLALGWISWTARDLADGEPRRAIVRASLVGSGVGFIVTLLFQLGGTPNPVGWLNVVLTALFTIGWAYFSYASMQTRTAAAPA